MKAYKEKQEQKKQAAIEAKKNGEGITSSFHSANVRKILFSNTQTERTSASNKYKSTFNLGESIYYLAYLKETIYASYTKIPNAIEDYSSTRARPKFVFTINNATKGFRIGGFNPVNHKKNVYTWTVWGEQLLTPQVSQSTRTSTAEMGLLNAIKNNDMLKTGVLEVKMEVYAYSGKMTIKDEGTTGELIASGSFKINITEEGLKQFMKRSDVCTKMPTENNIKLENYLIPHAKKHLTSKGRNFHSIYLQQVSWTIKKSYNGTVLGKSAEATVRFYNTKTKEYRSQLLTFYRVYENGKYFAPTVSPGASSRELCNCHK